VTTGRQVLPLLSVRQEMTRRLRDRQGRVLKKKTLVYEALRY
jgi:hypothetical protein